MSIVAFGAEGSRDRLLASCGIAGPVAFTAAWLASSLLQTGHSAGEVQLSGLAAMDARDPQIMIAGFAALGACSVAFGAALRRVTAAGTAGPWLVTAAGAATFAAGLFRRDHLLLTGPGFTGESWHNQVHDVVSGVAYAAMIAAPLVLAHGFRRDPDWAWPDRCGCWLCSAPPRWRCSRPGRCSRGTGPCSGPRSRCRWPRRC